MHFKPLYVPSELLRDPVKQFFFQKKTTAVRRERQLCSLKKNQFKREGEMEGQRNERMI